MKYFYKKSVDKGIKSIYNNYHANEWRNLKEENC